MSEYAPDKWIWSESDFERMSWHDVHIHAVAFQGQALAFDIDYMFRWIHPAPGETYFKFWISPATLVFNNVSDLRLELEPHGAPTIMSLVRSEAATIEGYSTTWLWSFECLDGQIEFRATGYRQFTRRPPILASAQSLSPDQRGDISFSRATP